MAKKDVDDGGGELTPSTLDRLIGAIEKMAEMQAAQIQAGRPENDESKAIMTALTKALERVSDNQLKGAEVMAQSYRQVHRPSNEVSHNRSVFHPRGNATLHPVEANFTQVRLVCEMWCPRQEQPNDNMLTREETELLNLLTKIPGTYVIKRIDDTKVKLTIVVEVSIDEVTPSKLVIKHETAFNNEYFRLMPPMHSQLRQIFAQHSSPDIRRAAMEILTMDEEELLIKAGKLSIAA